MQPIVSCQYYQRGDCRSCHWLHHDYVQQLAQKQLHLQQLLSHLAQSDLQWFEPCTSSVTHFRNKAKMVVSGSVERPILGILADTAHAQSAVDLCACPLYPQTFADIFPTVKDFIARAGLVPYNIAKQKGELKYILLTESRANQEIMLRFVLRSEQKLPLIQREIKGLLQRLPQVKVVSVNIQPQHAAILEGEQEIFLTEQQQLTECFNEIPLFIRPKSFFQTNPAVAEQLYATAQDWVKTLPINKLWDLFCGVGGFGLHCAKELQKQNPQIELTGIEISPSAIESATCSARQLNLSQVRFQSLDAAKFALDQTHKPDLIIVNPPRRGIGQTLAEFLNQLSPHFILYSSCNAVSMAKDLNYLNQYSMQKIRLFDMFPHTSHYEVLLLLQKKPS